MSVAKAGMVTSLPCSATVVAGAGPTRGRYDPDLTLAGNVGLPTPLLSRFDLIAVLRDMPDAKRDVLMADHVLERGREREEGMEDEREGGGEGNRETERVGCVHERLPTVRSEERTGESGRGGQGREDVDGGRQQSQASWTIKQLREYIRYVQRAFAPAVAPKASVLLQRYFQRVRRMASDGDHDEALRGRATVRLLESLVRVAQAHARLMCRASVAQQDAVVAIALVDIGASSTASCASIVPPSFNWDSFPQDPHTAYQLLEDSVFRGLGVPVAGNLGGGGLELVEGGTGAMVPVPSKRRNLSGWSMERCSNDDGDL